MTLPWTEIALRLVTATFLTSLVGLDRERRESSAGLRTHALVGMSSCLFMIASAFGFADILGAPSVTLDPSRIAAQIVTGIGFLGAGTIIAHGRQVRGLTTAASIWTVAAVGLAVGGGMYRAAFMATAVALLLLVIVHPLEQRLDQRWHKRFVRARYDPGVASLEGILAALHAAGLHCARLSMERGPDENRRQVQITLEESGEIAVQNAIRVLAGVTGVESASTH